MWWRTAWPAHWMCSNLFYEHHGDEDFTQVVRFIDWANVVWEETPLSGTSPRRRL